MADIVLGLKDASLFSVRTQMQTSEAVPCPGSGCLPGFNVSAQLTKFDFCSPSVWTLDSYDHENIFKLYIFYRPDDSQFTILLDVQ